jgi:hypothetical protein
MARYCQRHQPRSRKAEESIADVEALFARIERKKAA